MQVVGETVLGSCVCKLVAFPEVSTVFHTQTSPILPVVKRLLFGSQPMSKLPAWTHVAGLPPPPCVSVWAEPSMYATTLFAAVPCVPS